MSDNITFGTWEAISALIITMSTQIFLNMPRSVAETAGTAGWILTAYVSIIALVLFFIISRLYTKFKGMDIIDIGESAGGNAGRIIVGLLVIIHIVFIISVVLREFGEDIKIIALTQSPISFVTMFFITGMIVGAYMGIEAIMRIGAIIVPIVTIGFAIICIGVTQFFDVSRIMPILGNGPYQIFVKGLPRVSLFSGLIALFLIAPFIKTNKRFKKVGYISIGLSAVFMTLSTLIYLLVYPYPTAIENFLPIFQLSRLINYGRFFQRIESVFSLIWTATAFQYLSIAFFLLVYTFKKTFKLKYYKPLIFPFAILVFNISLLPQNLVSAIELETKYFRSVAWIVTFGMTIILLVIAGIVKRGGRKREKQGSKV